VVERSVTIAGISTKELVTKDFATEPNEETLRQSAHRMAQKLAGSLALVTCKEPLRSNLSSHMRQFLNEQGFTEVFSLVSTAPSNTHVFLQQMAPDQVVLLLVQDNIELACRAIEKAAMDRAVADVDENFAASYELRRRHRQVLAISSRLLRQSKLMLAALDKSRTTFLGCVCHEYQFLHQPAGSVANQTHRSAS
jgi:CCR4-NOT transcription complex subunit 1